MERVIDVYGSTRYVEDQRWLYFSQSIKGWVCKVCEMYPYSSGQSKDAFSARSCQISSHLSHAFKQHANSNCYQRLEKKITTNGVSVYD